MLGAIYFNFGECKSEKGSAGCALNFVCFINAKFPVLSFNRYNPGHLHLPEERKGVKRCQERSP